MTKAYAYKKANSSAQQVLEQYAPLVSRIAHHLIMRLPPNVLIEDLIQAGMIGLIEAHQNYDSTKGASFETYAGIRIKGAMVDDIRKGDWVPRSVHRNNREIINIISTLERELGREPTDLDIAERMGVNIKDYVKIQNDINASRLVGIEDLGLFDDGMNFELSKNDNKPFESVEQENFITHLAQAIDTLPEKEALVLSLYYDEELNLKEIGEIIGVSESRVCQIQNQGMQRLKAKLATWSG